MTIHEMNDAPVLDQLREHWQKMAALIVWKLAPNGVTISLDDIASFPAGGVLFTHGHKESFDFKIVTTAEAERRRAGSGEMDRARTGAAMTVPQSTDERLQLALQGAARWKYEYKCKPSGTYGGWAMALFDEIERLRAPVRPVVYSPCTAHMGQAFTMWVGPSAEPIVKCPICEPPEKPHV